MATIKYKKIRTDKPVFTVALTTLLTFLLLFFVPVKSFGIKPIWWLYPNILLAIIWFEYHIRLKSDNSEDESSQLLLRCVLFGCATTGTYLPLDWLFSRRVQFIVYHSLDFFGNVTTPIAIILSWVIFGTVYVYCYHRLRMCGIHPFVTSIITGGAAAIGSVIIYALGKELWVWNPLRLENIPNIASVPIFVPITYMLTFTLYPYYFHGKQHPLIAGIRCGLFLGIVMFLSFLIFRRIPNPSLG
ncbi:hypothetical protein C6497_16055 [Candidatus Poribacteria bacterium]|nr:MAG: hypothetical protein C6497_16055 [Candidatus Poribacteria bacterium]